MSVPPVHWWYSASATKLVGGCRWDKIFYFQGTGNVKRVQTDNLTEAEEVKKSLGSFYLTFRQDQDHKIISVLHVKLFKSNVTFDLYVEILSFTR